MSARVVPVGLLTSYLREVLETDALLADVWIEGDVSNAFRAQSGHIYFTVRDDHGQLKCALFRAHTARQRYLPQVGDAVAVHGRVSLYERDGSIQLYADSVQPAGLGILALQLEQLRQRLEAEGLFEPSRKRALPPAPKVIGVVTSAAGAVWHDIQNVLARRYPLAELILSPTPVQGPDAPGAIVAAIEAIQEQRRVDVVIVARGGGSPEDLMAFNDERVVRAIFACRVPVVAGIGHETDWSLADDAADLRAPTPSAAAELCAPSVTEIAQQLTYLGERLGDAMADIVESGREEVELLSDRLSRLTPRRQVEITHRLVAALSDRLERRGRDLVEAHRSHVANQRSLLAILHPARTFDRGYAVVHDGSGHPIFDVVDVGPGARLQIHLASGSIEAKATGVRSRVRHGSQVPV